MIRLLACRSRSWADLHIDTAQPQEQREAVAERVPSDPLRLRHIGRQPIAVDREAIHRERCQGQSLRKIAKSHRISTATVRRVLAGQPSEERVA